jgi:hypothetical protein
VPRGHLDGREDGVRRVLTFPRLRRQEYDVADELHPAARLGVPKSHRWDRRLILPTIVERP